MEIKDILSYTIEDILSFRKKFSNWVVLIWWATATGKSWLSLLLSKHFDIEIISSDSRQIYKYMDIWTDKVPIDIRKILPHHQIDIINPDEKYSVAQWQSAVEIIVPQIQNKGRIPVIVWWTWLYIDSIYKNFDMPNIEPDYELRHRMEQEEMKTPWILYKRLQRIDPTSSLKINFNSIRFIIRALEIFEKTGKPKSMLVKQSCAKRPLLMIWLRRDKYDTNEKIDIRIRQMFWNWLIDEVKWLIDKWYHADLPSMSWIWYKEIIWYLNWKYDMQSVEYVLKINTHQFAKRQRTRFRRYIKDMESNPQEKVVYKLYNLTN